jgi:hypothetical protein
MCSLLVTVTGQAQAQFIQQLSRQDAASKAAKDELGKLKNKLFMNDLSPRYFLSPILCSYFSLDDVYTWPF